MSFMRLSVLWRVTLLAGFCLVVIIAVLIISFISQSKHSDNLVSQSSREILSESAVLRMQGLAELQAGRVQRYFMDAYQYGSAVATQVDYLKQQAGTRGLSGLSLREDLVRQVRSSLAAKPDLLSLYLVLEPNTLSGADTEFLGNAEAGSNEIGRFAVYWGQGTKGDFTYLPLPESELANTAPGLSGSPYNYWYTCPRETLRACVLEPYAYKDEVTGQQLLVSSVSLPVVVDGKLIGVIGMDIRLQDLQGIAEAGHRELYAGAGHVSIISHQGLIAGFSRDASKLTARIEDADAQYGSVLHSKTTEGVPATLEQGGLLRIVQPFAPVPDGGKWSVVLDVPQQTLLEPAVELESVLATQRASTTITSSVLALVAALIGLICIWLTARGVSKPLLTVAVMLEDIASGEGDLTRRLRYDRRDELGRLSAGFNGFIDKLQPIISEVNGTVRDTRLTADQAANVANQTSAGMQQQFQEIEQVATASQEMSATASDVARSASLAADAARTADSAVQGGVEVIRTTMASIERLALDMSTAMREVESLADRSDQIGSVLDVIRAIADQTNLLALNAAIEAARAGDAGRGFSVVADEVRSLARRTQESVEEIRSVIETLQSSTEDVVCSMRTSHQQAQGSVQQVEQAVAVLKRIDEAVTVISDMNLQIASAAEEQSSVAEEITRNVSSIRDVTESLSLQAKESADVSQTLNRLANHQQKLMSHFRV